VDDNPSLGGREGPELTQLVISILPTVLGADPSVERDSYLPPLTDLYRPPFQLGTI
jgi:hypothetical protein